LAARHWVREVDAIETGLAAVPPERVHRVSHEDLVRAPVDRLRETAVFAGMSDDPGWRAELTRDRTTRSLGHPA
jgi:hypothetical protein